MSRPGIGTAGRLTLASLALLLLGGCATAPVPPPAAPVTYPPAPAEPRVQFLAHYTDAAQVAGQPGSLSRFLFGQQEAPDALAKPYGLVLHDGKLYVCDTKLNALVIFDLRNDRFGYTGVQGTERLRKPLNVCVDAQGRKLVADALRGEIVIFDQDDAWAGVFGGEVLERPVDVAATAGRIYVCDAGSCTIVVFDARSLERVAVLGGKGDGPGRFARPTNLALDADGNLYVSDTINGRVQKLAPDGSFLASFGKRGARPGTFARPKGVAIDPAGRLYVVDAAFENVQLFAPDGQVLMDLGGPGAGPGDLSLPAQVVIDTENIGLFAHRAAPGFEIEYLLLVSSQYGPRKINVYAFGHATGSDR